MISFLYIFFIFISEQNRMENIDLNDFIACVQNEV